MKSKKTKNLLWKCIKRFLFLLLVFIIFLLTYSIKWAKRNYGIISMDEIIFHLTSPLNGVASGLINDYLASALRPSILYTVLLGVWLYIPLKSRIVLKIRIFRERFKLGLFPLALPNVLTAVILIIWMANIFSDADNSFKLKTYLGNQIQQSKLMENEYVSPNDVSIVFPEKKRNLICIFLESMETSFMDSESGGNLSFNAIPELTRIANDNVSFSESDKLKGAYMTTGTTWTVAGLIAENTGVPVKIAGDHYILDRSMTLFGAKNLGDILKEEGYHNYFFSGSEFAFGGRNFFFKEHGDYTIWDYLSAKEEGKIPSDYLVWWGFEDVKLFEFVKEKLLNISQNDEPFNVSLITADTHFPSGYVCDRCEPKFGNQYLDVYACSSRLVSEFVEWVQQQDFYDNTTIFICGDHLSMEPSLFTDYDASENRRVYNAFINPAVQPVNQKNRQFTTMDMFPSIVASLGAQIEGNRLGLGTNLFSDCETLSEKYGNENLNAELLKKSNFYDLKIVNGDR